MQAKENVDPLNPTIKIWILTSCPYSVATEAVGKVDEISGKFILCDCVRNSHNHFVLQSTDIGEIWCWSLLGLKGLTFWKVQEQLLQL